MSIPIPRHLTPRRKAYMKAYMTPERCKHYADKWRSNNLEKSRAAKRKTYHRTNYYSRNREKILEQSKKWQKENRFRLNECRQKWIAKNPDKKEAYSRQHNLDALVKKHGMTLSEYTSLLLNQKGVCAICGKKGKQRLALDHSHSTGKVRGLLCTNCNHGIGKFKDDIDLLLSAAVYLTDRLEV